MKVSGILILVFVKDQHVCKIIQQMSSDQIYRHTCQVLWEPQHALEFLSSAPERRSPPAQLSTGFLKPGSDDEDSGPHRSSMPAWKKSSNPDSLEEPQQEKERNPGKTVTTAPQDADKDAMTRSRFYAFYFVALSNASISSNSVLSVFRWML